MSRPNYLSANTVRSLQIFGRAARQCAGPIVKLTWLRRLPGGTSDDKAEARHHPRFLFLAISPTLGEVTVMDVEFSIWLATRTRWAHLTKAISMSAVPRVGEFVKFANKELGDYFAYSVKQVTYRESGQIEVWTELLENIDDRGYSFEDETEFDEYLASYVAEGWTCSRGVQPNRRFLHDTSEPTAEDSAPQT